ncbi:MAG: glycerol-3-phosphate dehydrogenase/oxidase [bacterium]|nr:glycerol-3-phosphate dehydrogenase/oxidase [bacterium]
MFHPTWRAQALAGLTQPFDLLVLGGGVTGCGIFLDAAQRGLRVLLVERGDIASGTSSRSSKLIHGGLRYLKQMQIRVTRESCRERDRQLALNPHLVTPQRWIYPAYLGDKTPGWRVALGLKIYDRLTRGPEQSSRMEIEELEELAPNLGREGLERALSYFDARVDDARLTLAIAATGLAYGGSILTRAEPEGPILDVGGRLRGARVRDSLTGEAHQVEAALTINAAGVWVDRVRHRLGREGRRLRPSRGSHLIFPAEKLKLSAAVTMPSPDDRRPVFFIPHPEGVLVGTTDLFHDGELDDPRPTAAEVDYLLRATAATFPGDPPGRGDVVGSFAGLRPVLGHHLDDPSKASREEAIWHEDGLLSVAGGKLTTWRAIAEEAVDRAIALLPAARARRASACATAGTALAGLAPADLNLRLAAAHDLEPSVAAGMARRLGALAWTACGLAQRRRDLRPVVDGSDLCAAEVRAHLRFGAVVHLSDLLLRRVRLGMWCPEEVDELLPHLRRTVRREMGWSRGRWDLEVERYGWSSRGWTLDGVAPEGATE